MHVYSVVCPALHSSSLASERSLLPPPHTIPVLLNPYTGQAQPGHFNLHTVPAESQGGQHMSVCQFKSPGDDLDVSYGTLMTLPGWHK